MQVIKRHGYAAPDWIPIFFSSRRKENGHSWSKEKTLGDELACKRPTHPYERAADTHCRQNPKISCRLRRKSADRLRASPHLRIWHLSTCKENPLRLPFRCRSHALSENHLISCSNVSNSLPEKNSFNVMPKPSHSFLIVTMPGFLLFPYKMLLTVDVDTPDTLARWFTVHPRSPHNKISLLITAVLVSMPKPPRSLSTSMYERHLHKVVYIWYYIGDI